MKYFCPGCQRVLAFSRKDKLLPRKDVQILLRERQAPRLKCSCGQIIIILQAEA